MILMKLAPLALLLFAGSTYAQSATVMNHDDGDGGGGQNGGGTSTTAQINKVISHRLITDADTSEVTFNNGAKFSIDYQTGIGTYTNERGQRSNFPLSTLINAYANGDAAKAAEISSGLAASFSEPGLVADYSQLTSQNAGTQGIKISRRVNSNMYVPGSSSTYNCYFYYECYSYQFIVNDWGNYGGSFSLASSHYIRDYIDWRNWHNDQCDAAKSAGVESGFGATAMGVTCATAASGVGLLGCAAAGLYVVYTMNKLASATQSCSKGYSGPGNY